MRATKAIIHLDNLEHNIVQVKKLLQPETKICLPVKADAYGHGAIQIAIAAIKAGVSVLAVASVREGTELRDAGIVAPIISLSLPTLSEIDEILTNNIHPLVMDSEFIKALNERAGKLNTVGKVHLKIDTGMSRIGCTPHEATELARLIASCEHLQLCGIATHFSVADSKKAENIAFTQKQIRVFSEAVQSIRNAGVKVGLVHAANSGAIIQYPESYFDMVRPGIIVYGYPPSDELAGALDLKPVMSLITRVVLIKKLEAGTPVSYGCTWRAEKDTYIGTLPIGYADGLTRSLSHGLKVRIGKTFYPIVGTICMDQCMVDLGSTLNVKRWDEVEIFGTNTEEQSNTADTLAKIGGTISYEILANINKRVPRVYLS